MNSNKVYIAIDLKSFYASVECVDMGLDPLKANLVVADTSRSEKTICLAVSPNLKSYGIPGRPRLFEVIEKVKAYNENHYPPLEYIAAPPRMARYIEVSSKIYNIYLEYIAPEDIHVYSIDEVFIDATPYLELYKTNAHNLAIKMIRHILQETGITATAGIGTNLYLAKIAMDIVAKKMPADKDGVRIAELDEMSYRKILWKHEPITDFWRIGKGIAERLAKYDLYTMEDIAQCSVGKSSDYYNEELLYREFGINAEFLIDHAWGWEPCTISAIKAYKPQNHSLSSGQVLSHPYTNKNARIVIQEMAEELSLTLVRKGLVTNQIVINIGYDKENFTKPNLAYRWLKLHPEATEIEDMPGGAHGSGNIGLWTSSTRIIRTLAGEIFDRISDKELSIRRMNICASSVETREAAGKKTEPQIIQRDLFSNWEEEDRILENVKTELKKENALQDSVLNVKSRFGKNAIFKGMDLQEEATTIQRNNQIGGHRA